MTMTMTLATTTVKTMMTDAGPRLTPSTEEILQPKTFLSDKELAARWGVSVKTLSNQRSTGKGIVYHKLMGCVRYALADVLEAERSNRFRSPGHRIDVGGDD